MSVAHLNSIWSIVRKDFYGMRWKQIISEEYNFVVDGKVENYKTRNTYQ